MTDLSQNFGSSNFSLPPVVPLPTAASVPDSTMATPGTNTESDSFLGADQQPTSTDTALDFPAPASALLPAMPQDFTSQPTLPQPNVDEECLARVEQALDETELAIGLLEEEERRTSESKGTKPSTLISVIMPVYNEKTTIREIVRRVQAVDLSLELIIVDDYSLDGTRPILFELEKEYDNVRLFLHGYNQGKGAALRTGFEQVKGNIAIVQDADLEYDPNDYKKLIKPILDGEAEVVYGSRFLGEEIRDPSRLHRLGNGMLTWASNRMTGQRLTDMETCYKVFRCRVLSEFTIEQNRFGCEPEITAKISRMGLKIRELPIQYNGRGFEEGKKIGMRDAVAALWCIVRYRFKQY